MATAEISCGLSASSLRQLAHHFQGSGILLATLVLADLVLMGSGQGRQAMVRLRVGIAPEDHCKGWVRAALPHACPSSKDAAEGVATTGGAKLELSSYSFANDQHLLREERLLGKPGFAKALLATLAQARLQGK